MEGRATHQLRRDLHGLHGSRHQLGSRLPLSCDLLIHTAASLHVWTSLDEALST